MFDVDKFFPSRFFSGSDVNEVLKSDEQKVLILNRAKDNVTIYSRFNEDFSLFLSKLPNNDMKRIVLNIFNKNIVFIGISKVKPDNVFVRLLVTKDDSLAGVVLDAQKLGINPTTGESESIDEVVYATYFGAIRAAVIINSDTIRKDKKLNKLLSTYLFLLLIKTIGVDKIYNEKQRDFIHLLVIYIYYKYYLKERHSYIINILHKDYSDVVPAETIAEFSPVIEKMENYKSLQDFPKMLIDAKLFHESPSILMEKLLRIVRPLGFYNIMGPLDYFIPFTILSKYPVEIFSKSSLVNQKIQDSIEEIMITYMDKIKYDLTAIPKEY